MNLKLKIICISSGVCLVHTKKLHLQKIQQSPNIHLIYLTKCSQIHPVEKLTTKKLYLISLQHETTTSTFQKYLRSMFPNLTLQREHIL